MDISQNTLFWFAAASCLTCFAIGIFLMPFLQFEKSYNEIAKLIAASYNNAINIGIGLTIAGQRFFGMPTFLKEWVFT